MAYNKKSKILDVGAGWLRKTKDGKEYISLQVGRKGYTTRQGSYIPAQKVYLVTEGNENNPIEVTNLSLFFAKEKKNEKAPDLNLCLFQDE